MTTTNDQHASEFRREIAERTRPYVERLSAFRDKNTKVHAFVVETMSNLIDLIGYSSDSSIDEYQNSIDPIVDAPDYAEEYFACGYDNELFSDPTSAEYRSFATEVATAFAIHDQLTDDEKTFLRNMSDAWTLFDTITDDDSDEEFQRRLIALFDAQMTILENL